MSILNNLRGSEKKAPTPLFSSSIADEHKLALERMQKGQSSTSSKFPEKKKFQPQRFWLKKGETASYVIVDDKFAFSRREHSIKGPDGYFTQEPCLSDHDICPLCAQTDSKASDVAFLTVLDLRTYKNKEGKTVSFTKKILPVKKNDMPTFDALMQINGTFRGLLVEASRGMGDKESSIGKPSLAASVISEDKLLETFGHEARISDKGVVIVPENDSINPWDYQKYFAAPSATSLATKYNLAPVPGSLASCEQDEELPPWEETNLLELGETLPEVD